MTRNRVLLTAFSAGLFLLSSVMLLLLWSSNYQITLIIVRIAIYYFLISSGLIIIGLLKSKNKFNIISLIICLVVSFLAVLPITFSSSNSWRAAAILFVNKHNKYTTIEYCSNLDYNAKQGPNYYFYAQKAVIMRRKINFFLEQIEEINFNRYSYIMRNEKDNWSPVDTIPIEYLYNMRPGY